MEQQTADHGLEHAVDFLGWILPEKIPALINAATVVVMPSRWEGHPLVALQATLMARPIVATRVGGIPEIVEHERTGLLVEKENSTALAKAIMRLLDDLTVATQMGQNARRRAQSMFSWEGCVDAYDTLYQELIMNWHKRSTLPDAPPTTLSEEA